MDAFDDSPVETPPADAPADGDFEDDAVVVSDNNENEEGLPNGNGIAPTGDIVDDEVNAMNAAMDDMSVAEPTTDEPTFSPPRPQEEPETIKVWREEQQKRLEDKDAKETEEMGELREQAKKELGDW